MSRLYFFCFSSLSSSSLPLCFVVSESKWVYTYDYLRLFYQTRCYKNKIQIFIRSLSWCRACYHSVLCACVHKVKYSLLFLFQMQNFHTIYKQDIKLDENLIMFLLLWTWKRHCVYFKSIFNVIFISLFLVNASRPLPHHFILLSAFLFLALQCHSLSQLENTVAAAGTKLIFSLIAYVDWQVIMPLKRGS